MKIGILIYGATGYTGKLLARTLVARGVKPVLAARNAKVAEVAKELGCEHRVFTVEEAAGHLAEVDVLVNLAGPFGITQGGLIRACIANKVHYLDIAGEVPEMEAAYAFSQAAEDAGIVLVPGAGFGVVPTDIAAKLAVERLEGADRLVISYATKGGASRGTLKTVLKDIHKPGVVIRAGKAALAQPAMGSHDFTVDGRRFKGVYNPWRADLYTAQVSTGVPNIETYTVFPGLIVKMMKGGLGWLRKFMLHRLVNWLPEGPSPKQLAKGATFVHAVAYKDGRSASVEISGPEAYVFTTECIFQVLLALDKGTTLKGAIPPSTFGRELIEPIDGLSISV